jgi:hypothetical protein
MMYFGFHVNIMQMKRRPKWLDILVKMMRKVRGK